MAKLLRNAVRDGGLIIESGTGTLDHHPELAKLGMQVIESFSQIEQRMLNLFIFLMGGVENDVAIAMYLALNANGPKTQAIQEISKIVLSAQNQIELAKLLRFAKTAQKQRDKLAHWVWSMSASFPDAVLLMNPHGAEKANLHATKAMKKYFADSPLDPDNSLFDRISEDWVRSSMGETYIYEKKDFLADLERCHLTSQVFTLFYMRLSMEREGRDRNELVEQKYHELCDQLAS